MITVKERDDGDTSPSAGGCWFCHSDDPEPEEFDMEFDAFYHESCAEEEGVAGEDIPILAYERR